MISLIIILAICILCCLCSSSMGGGTYYEYSQNRRSYIIPSEFNFKSKPGYKYLGHTIKTLNKSLNECMGICLDDPHCVGLTYNSQNKECDLQAQNYRTDPDFANEWDENHTCFARNDPKKRIEKKKGKVNTISYISEEHKVESLNECVEKCIGAKDLCISANYYDSGKCEFMRDLEDNDNLENKSGATYFYKKGTPGLSCEKPSDCVYGACKNNICLINGPSEQGLGCDGNRDCISAYCDNIIVPYETQKEEQQEYLNNSDPTAELCDAYKTCGECMESSINKFGKTISGALCEWRGPNKNPKYEDIDCESNSNCPTGLACEDGKCKCTEESCSGGWCIKDTCFLPGEEGTCFRRDITTDENKCR